MIDSHQHIWSIGRHGCAWPTAAERNIYRDYSLDDFRREALRHGVTATVLVQSQEDDQDTDWLLDIAAEDDLVAGVVGWADLSAPDAVQRIARLAARPKLVGLRPMVQHRESDWFDDRALEPSFGRIAEQGLRLDALVRLQHLAALDRLASRVPQLQIVIDHAAKPVIDSTDGFEVWRNAIAPLAERRNVSCKLSGLLTECGDAPAQAIEPYVESILDLFGPERVMWGSDWPVVEMVSTYGEWLAIARRLVPQSAWEAVFGGTAARFYGLMTEVAA